MSASEFLFFINTPMEGADKRLIHVFINKCLVNPLLYSILICYMFCNGNYFIAI